MDGADPMAVSVADAARLLGRTEERILQLLNEHCSTLVAQAGGKTAQTFELDSPEGHPTRSTHTFGRTVYQSSLNSFKDRHDESKGGRWLHRNASIRAETHEDVEPSDYAAVPQAGAAYSRHDSEGHDGIQVLMLRLAEADRQARQREEHHLAELLEREDQMERLELENVRLHYAARRAGLRSDLALRIDIRGRADRNALESAITHEHGHNDTSSL